MSIKSYYFCEYTLISKKNHQIQNTKNASISYELIKELTRPWDEVKLWLQAKVLFRYYSGTDQIHYNFNVQA